MQRNAAAVRWRYRLYRFAKRGLLPLLAVFLAAGVIVLNGFQLRLNPEGDSQLTLKFGENYTESGVTAYLAGKYFLKDGIAVDARISSSGCVDPLMAGSYSLFYEAEWLFFQAAASRTVTVLEGHDPVITLDIIEGHYTLPGGEYQEEGYRAFDEEDGDLTDLVTREEKDGCVYYTVTDSHGNQACAERDIFYCDPEPPVITLEGDQEMSVYLDAKYSEPGYTAMDNADGDLTDQVQVKGKVKTSKTGTYTITYTLKDSYGNEASAERIVHVVKRTVPDTVMPEGKTIYLTFDDGPGPYTEKLLDILEKYDVKATFFVVDTKYLHLLPRMVEDGHAIGIHSITHDYRDIYASKSAYFQDLEGMQDIIYETCGVRTYLMRFPGGSSNTVSKFNKKIMTKLTQAVQKEGFCYFDWNVDSYDAGGAVSADEVFTHVTQGVQKQEVSVVLQHDIKEFSVDAVERIILWGLENGYQFLPLTETSPGMHHEVNN